MRGLGHASVNRVVCGDGPVERGWNIWRQVQFVLLSAVEKVAVGVVHGVGILRSHSDGVVDHGGGRREGDLKVGGAGVDVLIGGGVPIGVDAPQTLM